MTKLPCTFVMVWISPTGRQPCPAQPGPLPLKAHAGFQCPPTCFPCLLHVAPLASQREPWTAAFFGYVDKGQVCVRHHFFFGLVTTSGLPSILQNRAKSKIRVLRLNTPLYNRTLALTRSKACPRVATLHSPSTGSNQCIVEEEGWCHISTSKNVCGRGLTLA